MSQATSLRGVRVLLVEDDDAARLSLIRVLGRVGYTVEAVSDGEQALMLLEAQASSGRFDVVLTDLVLREVDGVEVLRRVRRLPDPPEVVLLTGYGTLQTAIEALRAGAFDYLLKPCRPDDLLGSIERAAERRAAQVAQQAAVQVLARSLRHMGDSPGGAGVSSARAEARPPAGPRPHYQVGELKINRIDHSVLFAGEPVTLTATEYAILCCLADAGGHVVGYGEIVRSVYQQSCDERTAQRSLKTHVHNLRGKLLADYIVNVRSTGYKLAEPRARPQA